MPLPDLVMSGRWSRRLNRWHDPEGPLHLQKDDNSPACGASYYTMEGPRSDVPPLRSQCCGRCVRIADALAALG